MGGDVQLSRLVDVSNADETLKEVIHICRLIKPDFNTDELTEAFEKFKIFLRETIRVFRLAILNIMILPIL